MAGAAAAATAAVASAAGIPRLVVDSVKALNILCAMNEPAGSLIVALAQLNPTVGDLDGTPR